MGPPDHQSCQLLRAHRIPHLHLIAEGEPDDSMAIGRQRERRISSLQAGRSCP